MHVSVFVMRRDVVIAAFTALAVRYFHFRRGAVLHRDVLHLVHAHRFVLAAGFAATLFGLLMLFALRFIIPADGLHVAGHLAVSGAHAFHAVFSSTTKL